MKIKLGDFAEAISTRIWDSVGRANWRNFEDARAFAHNLGLKSRSEWEEYCASDKKPADIPSWAGWGDWLGTGTVALHQREYRPFKRARAFVRRLGLKSYSQWRDYCRSGKKPADIPANPRQTYADAGWSGLGDWLGTGRVADRLREFLPFEKARSFVRKLHLRSEKDWREYCKSGKKPGDIPGDAYRVYAGAGWAGMGDWLGTGRRIRGTGWRPFKKARSFVRRLGLKSSAEWYHYCKSGKKPADIPFNPSKTYAKAGWAGMGDWLGTGAIAAQLRKYRSFKKARSFVHCLGLKSQIEWREFVKSDKKPDDIPSNPNNAYADAGWNGFGDWLGTGRVRGAGWRPFEGSCVHTPSEFKIRDRVARLY